MLKNSKGLITATIYLLATLLTPPVTLAAGYNPGDTAISSRPTVSSLKNKYADYFENRLGIIEVGKTSIEILRYYIGNGEKFSSGLGSNTYYYLDPVNKKTLIVQTDSHDIIEIVDYRNEVVLPPGKTSLDDVSVSPKLNIRNLMTSKGSRMGYSYTMIVSTYGRPSEVIQDNKNKYLKYIMIGINEQKKDFVYLEYSFKLENNKVVEIRIENGK